MFSLQLVGHHRCVQNHQCHHKCVRKSCEKSPHFADQPLQHYKYDQKSCNKTSTFHWTAGWRSLMCKKNHVTKSQHFTSGKGGTWCHRAFEEGGRHVFTCDKPSTSKPGFGKNTWMDCTGVRMSQVWIVTADSSLGGHTYSVGQIITWSICGWTDSQGINNLKG
jgi:hypothetical protein